MAVRDLRGTPTLTSAIFFLSLTGRIEGREGGRESFITTTLQTKISEVSSEGSSTVAELTEGIRGGASLTGHCEEREEQRGREQLWALPGWPSSTQEEEVLPLLRQEKTRCEAGEASERLDNSRSEHWQAY